MARKHFDSYFAQISNQYFQLNDALQELSKEVNEGMMEPERLEQLKATILPVKNSYETLNYIRYLLDKPTRKSKQARYDRQSKKVLSRCGNKSADRVIVENDVIIRGLRNK